MKLFSRMKILDSQTKTFTIFVGNGGNTKLQGCCEFCSYRGAIKRCILSVHIRFRHKNFLTTKRLNLIFWCFIKLFSSYFPIPWKLNVFNLTTFWGQKEINRVSNPCTFSFNSYNLSTFYKIYVFNPTNSCFCLFLV